MNELNKQMSENNLFLYNYLIWNKYYVNSIDLPVKTQIPILIQNKLHVISLNILWYFENKSSIEEAYQVNQVLNNVWFDVWNLDIKSVDFKLLKDTVKEWLICTWYLANNKNEEAKICAKLKDDFLKNVNN